MTTQMVAYVEMKCDIPGCDYGQGANEPTKVEVLKDSGWEELRPFDESYIPKFLTICPGHAKMIRQGKFHFAEGGLQGKCAFNESEQSKDAAAG